MTWHHNAEKVLSILFKEKGDKDGWVVMNDHLKKEGLIHPGDIKFAFHWLADKDRKWVESVPPHSMMELSIWGPHKRIMSLENTTIKARLTQFGKDEKVRRSKPTQWAAWVAAVSGTIAAIVAVLMFIEQRSSQSPPARQEDGVGRSRQPIEATQPINQRTPTESGPPSSSVHHTPPDLSASRDSVPTIPSGTDSVQPSSSSHAPVEKKK